MSQADPARRSPKPADCERFGLPADRPFVVSLASLEERNGSWELPQLASRWATLTPRPFLVVSGSGPLEEEALRWSRRGGPDFEHSALVWGQLRRRRRPD